MSLALHGECSAASAPPARAALPVVMLHGWGMNLRVFDLLRAELPGRETCAIDLPGHGLSPWSDSALDFDAQRDAVLALLPPRCVLLGWSFGAKLAMAIAALAPQRVAALVLVAASPKFQQSPDWPHGMDPSGLAAFRSVLEQDWRQTLDDFVWLQMRGSRHAAEAGAAMQAALAAHGAPRPEALRNGLVLLGDLDLRPLLSRIAQPVLLVAGQNDRVTPPGAARWLAGQWPQAKLLELPRAGHAPFLSHAAEVGAATREFLDTLPEAAS